MIKKSKTTKNVTGNILHTKKLKIKNKFDLQNIESNTF